MTGERLNSVTWPGQPGTGSVRWSGPGRYAATQSLTSSVGEITRRYYFDPDAPNGDAPKCPEIYEAGNG